MKTIRDARSLAPQTCPIIPGRPGPVEPFHPRCFGDAPETWASVRAYFERAYTWDARVLDLPTHPAAIEDAVDLAVGLLWLTQTATWARWQVGYGDRYRALQAIRGSARRRHWRSRKGDNPAVRAGRKRPWVQSMSAQPHDPARLVAMAEAAEVVGVVGKAAGRGHRRTERRSVSVQAAILAIQGAPVVERVEGTVPVQGGSACQETDGRMANVLTRQTEFEFHPGARDARGRWWRDVDAEPETLVEVETRWKMVRSTAGRPTEYPAGPVPNVVDAGPPAALDPVTPPPPAPAPWTEEEHSRITNRRPSDGQWAEVTDDALRRAGGRAWLRVAD